MTGRAQHARTSKVRTATVADLRALVKLERQADTAAHWNQENYAAIFAGAAPRRIALVTERGNAVAGFIVARAAGSEWEIENIVVAANLCRQGIASGLIRELISQVRTQGGDGILLEVRESNSAARALYEKTGFLQDRRRSRYYHDPEEDAICYSLDFRGAKAGRIPENGKK